MLKSFFIESILICSLIFNLLVMVSIYHFEGYKYYNYFYASLIISLVIFLCTYFKFKKNIKIKSIFFIFFKIFYFFEFYTLVGTIYNFIILTFFSDKNINLKKKCFDFLFNTLFFLCVCSIIEYLYCLYIDDFFLTPVISPIKQGIIYNKGFFNSFLETFDGIRFIRMLSIFNEPGYLGTFLGIFILFTKKENKIKMGIIYLAGFLTVSTAFLYFIFMKFLIENLSLKKCFKFFVYCFILVNLLFVCKNNDFINKYVIIKIEKIIKNKDLNRSSIEDKKILKEFYKNGNIILGERKEFKSNGGHTLGMLIYQVGIIGVIIDIILFLNIANFFSIKFLKTKLLILIALSSILQRPEILSVTTLLCIYCGPFHYNQKLMNLKGD